MWGQGEGSTPTLPHPRPGHPEPTLRYWYKQMDIQLDSILSTTVSDLQEHSGVPEGSLSVPGPSWLLLHSQHCHPGPGPPSECTHTAWSDHVLDSSFHPTPA